MNPSPNAGGRRLIRILCWRKHGIADVVATSKGPLLRIPKVTLGHLDKTAKHGYRKEAGDPQERLLVDDPFFRNDGVGVTCPRCGTDFRFYPLDINRRIAAGERTAIIRPTRPR